MSNVLGILQSGTGAQPAFNQLRVLWYASDQLVEEDDSRVIPLEQIRGGIEDTCSSRRFFSQLKTHVTRALQGVFWPADVLAVEGEDAVDSWCIHGSTQPLQPS